MSPRLRTRFPRKKDARHLAGWQFRLLAWLPDNDQAQRRGWTPPRGTAPAYPRPLQRLVRRHTSGNPFRADFEHRLPHGIASLASGRLLRKLLLPLLASKCVTVLVSTNRGGDVHGELVLSALRQCRQPHGVPSGDSARRRGLESREIRVTALIHPLIFKRHSTRYTKDFLEYPLLDSLIRPVGNMVIQHQPPDETTSAFDISPCSPLTTGRSPSSPPPLPTTTTMQSPTH